MPLYSETNTPEQNLAVLAENPYPGRLLVVGFYAAEVLVLAYAVEGRSEGSRNRRLVIQDDIVSTEVADTSKAVGDPELTIYDAMRRVGDLEIVSNGNQTDRVVRYIRSGKTFADAMDVTKHEPDLPIFTPRITGFHDLDGDARLFFGISVISKDSEGDGSIRRLYTNQSPEIDALDNGEDNIGFCVHTYKPGKDMPASFDEQPFIIPTQPSARDMAEMLRESLNPQNRVSVVAKYFKAGQKPEFSAINEY